MTGALNASLSYPADMSRLHLSDPVRSALILGVAMLPILAFAIVSIWLF